MFQLRRAHAPDAAPLGALVNAAYRGDSGRRGWTTESDLLAGQRTDNTLLADTISKTANALLIAQESVGTLLGCVLLSRVSAETAYLGMLTVSVDHQKRGVGDFLLRSAERWAQENFHSRRIRMTVIRQRLELISWYERRGYFATGETEPFPYVDERFGIPLRPDLEFRVFEKAISESSRRPSAESRSP